MHSNRALSLFVVVSSVSLCFASHPAEALPVQATVNGVTYDVTTFYGTYDENTSKFALPPNGLMPWWGSVSIATQFATEVSDRLGLPLAGFGGPVFAYNAYPDPYDIGSSIIDGRIYNSLIPGIDDTLTSSPYTETYAIAVPAAAHWYDELLCRRERAGRSMATADAVIAATALANGASLATRDGADFADLGLALINPWTMG